MFNSLKSAWGQVKGAASSVKETLVSSVAKGKEIFNAFLPPEVDHRPEVRQQVGEVLGKGRLDNVILDLPTAQWKKSAQNSVSSVKYGMGIQTWASADENPLRVFHDFERSGLKDETPMTSSFYSEVRDDARQKGRFDFDPFANLNHGLRSNEGKASAPALSRITRIVPEPVAQVATSEQEGGAQVIPFRRPVRQEVAQIPRKSMDMADAWMLSPKTFKQMVAETRGEVGQTLKMAA